MSHKIDISVEATKMAPPVAISSVSYFLAISLDSWVHIATLVYLALASAHLVWKFRHKGGSADEADK